jgi:hypothetical protein
MGPRRVLVCCGVRGMCFGGGVLSTLGTRLLPAECLLILCTQRFLSTAANEQEYTSSKTLPLGELEWISSFVDRNLSRHHVPLSSASSQAQVEFGSTTPQLHLIPLLNKASVPCSSCEKQVCTDSSIKHVNFSARSVERNFQTLPLNLLRKLLRHASLCIYISEKGRKSSNRKLPVDV